MNKIVIDCAVFSYDNGCLKVLLSKNEIRANAQWGIITGELKNTENADETALRLLKESGIANKLFLKQFKTFAGPHRNLSEDVITIGYYALINMKDYKISYGATSLYQRWRNVKEVPELLFNHNKILDFSLYELSNYIRESAIGFELLPEFFTLSEMMNFYKEVLDTESSEWAFCEKIVHNKVVLPVENINQNLPSRSVGLYKFNAPVYKKLTSKEVFFRF